MDSFIKSIIDGGNINKIATTSYNRLLYGRDSLSGGYFPEFREPITLPIIPSESTIEMMRKKHIIGNNDYPIFERGLELKSIDKLGAPYDNLYKNIPPANMISNKARLVPTLKNTALNAPPQNINDALKPLNKRFKYFVKPTSSYETQELLNTATDQSIIDEIESINGADKGNFNRNSIYIPVSFYNHYWHTFNKNFIMNRAKMSTSTARSTGFIDPALFKELKRIYPNVSDYVLRADYDKLIVKNNLAPCNINETAAANLIRRNPVIARLAALLNGVSNNAQLHEKINEITINIPFTYITAKFPSINNNILKSNSELYKLAFMCGSTNETIIGDILEISGYINSILRP
jgi:hypothetical protein